MTLFIPIGCIEIDKNINKKINCDKVTKFFCAMLKLWKSKYPKLYNNIGIDIISRKIRIMEDIAITYKMLASG